MTRLRKAHDDISKRRFDRLSVTWRNTPDVNPVLNVLASQSSPSLRLSSDPVLPPSIIPQPSPIIQPSPLISANNHFGLLKGPGSLVSSANSPALSKIGSTNEKFPEVSPQPTDERVDKVDTQEIVSRLKQELVPQIEKVIEKVLLKHGLLRSRRKSKR